MRDSITAQLITIFLALTLLLCFGCGDGSPTDPDPGEDLEPVLIRTNMGDITIGLNRDAAPATVANFLRYTDEAFYDGTIFHRVIDGFMIQGGGYSEDLERKEMHDPIANESDNDLSNLRGTISMARLNSPHSATSQFFINAVDNIYLDYREEKWGYCVFGIVLEGMDVVDDIIKVRTGTRAPFPSDVPLENVVILEVSRVLQTDLAASIPQAGRSIRTSQFRLERVGSRASRRSNQ